MRYAFLLLCIFASYVWSGTATYDPFELEFFPSTSGESSPYVAHRNMKLLHVAPELEELIIEQLDNARHANSKIVISFSGNINRANDDTELRNKFRLVCEEPENQRYKFHYNEIKYSKKIIFGSDYILYRIGEDWKEIKIASRDLMEGLMNQIDFAKKHKKWVSINLDLLEDIKRQEFVKPLAVISILPS